MLFGDKKVLGILIRGTDYYTMGQVGEHIMAGVDDMLPLINKWLEEEKYDNIFLASENADTLENTAINYFYALYML